MSLQTPRRTPRVPGPLAIASSPPLWQKKNQGMSIGVAAYTDILGRAPAGQRLVKGLSGEEKRLYTLKGLAWITPSGTGLGPSPLTRLALFCRGAEVPAPWKSRFCSPHTQNSNAAQPVSCIVRA